VGAIFVNVIVQCILIHILFSTLIAAFLALVFQGLNGWIAIVSLVGGGTISFVFRRHLQVMSEGWKRKWDWIDKAIISFILLLGVRQYAYLYFSIDNGVNTLLRNNYGDLPLHLSYIRHMAAGTIFPPINPFFSLEKLRYPLGIDLYNALWESLGVPTQAHLFLIGIVLLLAAVLALQRFGGILLVGAFFFNGGWTGWQLLTSGVLLDYQEALTWKNFFITLFIPQRSLWMGLPLGVWLIYQVRDQFYEEFQTRKPWGRAQTFLLGTAWGVLPFFHMQAFIVVSLLIAFYTLTGPTPKSNLLALWPVLIWAVPLGTMFVLYLTDMFQKGSMIHFQWSWFSPKNLAIFFGVELGPWTVFILGVGAYRLWKGQWRERGEWLMAILGFLLFNALLLAPWDWDKLKILIWFYLVVIALCVRGVEPYLTTWRKAALCVGLFFSGIVCMLAVSGNRAQPTELYEWRELWNTKGAMGAISKDAVIAATPTFNHPLSFWGYAIAVGYSGHLWSHGVDYQGPEEMIDRLYQDGTDWAAIADRLQLTHIFWGPMEKERYGTKPPPWRAALVNLSPVPGYEIYSLASRKHIP
jgi:hypothetical protein